MKAKSLFTAFLGLAFLIMFAPITSADTKEVKSDPNPHKFERSIPLPGSSFIKGNLRAVNYGHGEIELKDVNGQPKTVYVPLFRIEIGQVPEARALSWMKGMNAKYFFPSEKQAGRWELADVRRPDSSRNEPGLNKKTLVNRIDLPRPLCFLSPEELNSIEFFIVYYDTKGINIYFNPILPQKLGEIFKRLLELQKVAPA